jgi:putative exoH protein
LFLLIIAIGSSLRPGWTAIIDKPLSNFTIKDYLLIFWDTSLIGQKGGLATPIDIPLWFVRNLMVLSLASPLIYRTIHFLSRWHKRLALYMLLIFLYAIHYLPDQWEGWGQSLLFFSLGATFTILKWDVTKLFKPYGIYGIIGACLFYWAQLANLMYAALIVTIISLTTYIIERRQQQGLTSKLIPNILTDSSFFIYAAHTLPQGIILWSLKLEWLPITGATSVLIVYFLSPVILTTVCLLSFILLRRISPISLYFLTGGRQ